eukprot:TRINITY_DN3945_c0_g1_i4.p1 TRINITY_DN3945_c0_g1~~TRINITY_DN3945_c0_g1_i4.p1  ORF type:complete len:510 (+),score=61.54 TRINITY_DN3945_c0_g1_i4:375-1904(+)
MRVFPGQMNLAKNPLDMFYFNRVAFECPPALVPANGTQFDSPPCILRYSAREPPVRTVVRFEGSVILDALPPSDAPLELWRGPIYGSCGPLNDPPFCVNQTRVRISVESSASVELALAPNARQTEFSRIFQGKTGQRTIMRDDGIFLLLLWSPLGAEGSVNISVRDKEHDWARSGSHYTCQMQPGEKCEILASDEAVRSTLTLHSDFEILDTAAFPNTEKGFWRVNVSKERSWVFTVAVSLILVCALLVVALEPTPQDLISRLDTGRFVIFTYYRVFLSTLEALSIYLALREGVAAMPPYLRWAPWVLLGLRLLSHTLVVSGFIRALQVVIDNPAHRLSAVAAATLWPLFPLLHAASIAHALPSGWRLQQLPPTYQIALRETLPLTRIDLDRESLHIQDIEDDKSSLGGGSNSSTPRLLPWKGARAALIQALSVQESSHFYFDRELAERSCLAEGLLSRFLWGVAAVLSAFFSGNFASNCTGRCAAGHRKVDNCSLGATVWPVVCGVGV